MTSTEPNPSQAAVSLAVSRAARDFARSLAREDMLGCAVRLEATIYAGEEFAFDVDRALADAWPREAGLAPAHEVILARAGGAVQGLKLSAFDDRGRALLRRNYMADAGGQVQRLNAEPKSKPADHV
jgi:hypothetical protein